MKNIEQLHELLNDNNTKHELKRSELTVFLKGQIEFAQNDRADKKSIAYDIASLLGTHYASELEISDVTDQILTLAGELEVDYDENKWQLIILMIKSL